MDTGGHGLLELISCRMIWQLPVYSSLQHGKPARDLQVCDHLILLG